MTIFRYSEYVRLRRDGWEDFGACVSKICGVIACRHFGECCEYHFYRNELKCFEGRICPFDHSSCSLIHLRNEDETL